MLSLCRRDFCLGLADSGAGVLGGRSLVMLGQKDRVTDGWGLAETLEEALANFRARPWQPYHAARAELSLRKLVGPGVAIWL